MQQLLVLHCTIPRYNLVREGATEHPLNERASAPAAPLQLVHEVGAEFVHVFLLRVSQRLPIVVLCTRNVLGQ